MEFNLGYYYLPEVPSLCSYMGFTIFFLFYPRNWNSYARSPCPFSE